MIANYFKSAFRNIARSKGYSAINIVGLAVGVASSLAVFLWVLDEINYDKFHANGDLIYRCNRQLTRDGQARSDEVTSAPIGPAIKERTPDILEYARTAEQYAELRYQEANTLERGMFVDPAFLTMFSFPLVEGDPATVLSSPTSIVLTEEVAVKLFGDADPIGKILDNGMTVTGVARDVPGNSSIEFGFLAPMLCAEQVGRVSPDEWFFFSLRTYFLVREGADVEKVSLQIRDLFKEVEPEATLQLQLQPLADIHLINPGGGGKIIYVYVFTIVAVLLIVVACVNYVNLATARASRRLNEIGVRKAVGASRWQLAWQIITESLVQTAIAVTLAVCLLEAILPQLGGLFGKQLALELSAGAVITLIAAVLALALASGAYPALLLSSLRPAAVLKGNASSGGRPAMNRLRKVLVVFQFAVSSGLIFGALVINDQLNFINNKDLGIDKDNIVTVRLNGLADDYQTIKSELLQHPGVLGVTAVMEPPAWCGWYAVGFEYEGKPEDEDIRAGFAWVDHDYLDLFGMQIIDGRKFSRQYATDESEAYVINEAAAAAMQMDSPVGKTLEVDERNGRIIGVVKDFHYSSLHSEIEPLIIGINKSQFEFLCIKISSDDIQGATGFIQEKLRQFRFGQELDYRFFDDLLYRGYRADVQTGRIILSFTLVTVLVACLGLLGLAAYSAERRTKEISIRKVLGSTEAGIIGLLTKEFIILVALGNLIAAPVVYYAAKRWLDNFAYRIELGWETLALSSALAILVALLTVCYQAMKAARSNPVDALKYE